MLYILFFNCIFLFAVGWSSSGSGGRTEDSEVLASPPTGHPQSTQQV